MNESAEQAAATRPVKLEGRSHEARILASLTGLINTPEFSQDDGGAPGRFAPPPIDLTPTQADQVAAQLVPPPAAVAVAVAVAVSPGVRALPSRIFTTGRLLVGKDYVLSRFGFRIHGFAEPLYALQKVFFGTDDKKVPGARPFLQKVGQWGRGTVTEQYPLSPERAVFCQLIRKMVLTPSLENLGVVWENFGTENLWLDALLSRVEKEGAERAGVSNVRFENEYHGLAGAGWTHFHVMCSPETWSKRLKESGLTPNSPEVRDTSEKMAIALDANSLSTAKMNPKGGKLRIIWNDPAMRSPSSRFYTLPELA